MVKIVVPNELSFHCGSQNITGLDLSNCPNLTGLWCNDNQLTK